MNSNDETTDIVPHHAQLIQMAMGHLLTTILGSCRGPRGILFDLPHVVKDAPAGFVRPV